MPLALRPVELLLGSEGPTWTLIFQNAFDPKGVKARRSCRLRVNPAVRPQASAEAIAGLCCSLPIFSALARAWVSVAGWPQVLVGFGILLSATGLPFRSPGTGPPGRRCRWSLREDGARLLAGPQRRVA